MVEIQNSSTLDSNNENEELKKWIQNRWEKHQYNVQYEEADLKTILGGWKNWISKFNKETNENSELQIGDWVNNSDDKTLWYFIKKESDIFGGITVYNPKFLMIYKNKKGDKCKWYQDNKLKEIPLKNAINNNELKNKFSDLKTILKNAILIKDENFNTEAKEFSSKQLLRKAAILTSHLYQFDDGDLNGIKEEDKYMDIFSENALEALAKIFDVELDSNNTFMNNNSIVYNEAKNFVFPTKNNFKDIVECRKFNDFLWNLYINLKNINEFNNYDSLNFIFHGAPGTGKTYAIKESIDFLFKTSNKYDKHDKNIIYKYIQFHPSFTYQDFIEGIKPYGVKNGNLNLKVTNGVFKQFCIDVARKNEENWDSITNEGKNPPKPNNLKSLENWPHYYFVVDEINRGNLSSIFGETFSLLEKDYRDYDFSIKTKNCNHDYSNSDFQNSNSLYETALSAVIQNLPDTDKKEKDEKENLIYKTINGTPRFGIPFNIHFIGSMNDVDRSIDAFDLALRRRFKWILRTCDYDVLKSELRDYENLDKYIEACKVLNNYITGGDNGNKDGFKLGKIYEIGHAYFLKIAGLNSGKTITEDKVKELFETYIEGTLREYLKQDYDDSEIDNKIKGAIKIFRDTFKGCDNIENQTVE